MSHHILYCNEDADLLVLDLPTSISHAQNTTRQLRSTPAPGLPYLTPEPKGAKRALLQSTVPPDESRFHLETQTLLRSALALLHGHRPRVTWCHPRVYIDSSRFLVERECLSHNVGSIVSEAAPPLVLSTSLNNVCCASALTNVVVCNPHQVSTDLLVTTRGTYRIPSQSVFLNADIEHGTSAFKVAVHCLLPKSRFDLILLDPPWNNRSVRHSRAYSTAECQLSDPFGQILPLVTEYLSEDGFVAVWITNKAAVRSTVLKECCSRGLVLEEEWLWLKVTGQGETVTPIDGFWRKPYEILLLFHRCSKRQKVTRRIGIAVPDVHSRKPSLRSMFEQLLPERYNALEVFARSLTAGWWSWGDEVLKFQHEDNWT